MSIIFNPIMVEKFLRVSFGSLFMAIAANLCVPWVPVPFTFQTVAVLVIAAILGAELGTWAILTYLIEGALGLPVFSKFNSGIAWILGPTGGYLLGLLPAVYVAGNLLKKTSNLLGIFAAVVSSFTIIFVCGWLHLSNIIGFQTAYQLGVAPFVITELFKAIIAVVAISRIKK